MSTFTHFRRLSVILLVMCGFALVSGGCANDKKVMAQADQMHTGLKPAVMNDQELSQYLQKVGDRIIEAAQQLDKEGYGPKSHKSEDNAWMFSDKMQFHFVNSKTMNAFTTGGEHMYIYNELFQQCKSEDELAAVMAHEYGHVYARHVEKGMDRQLGTMVAAGAAGVGGYFLGGKGHEMETAGAAAGATMVAGQFVGMGYTRGDEDEADKLGFMFYTRAGWDPNHFADFFKHMIAAGYDKTPQYMSDHPTLANRVKATDERIKNLPKDASKWRRPPIADAQQFAALQARAAQLAKTMPDDKSLQQAQTILASFSSCVTPVDQPDQKQARQKLQKDVEEIKSGKSQ